MLTPQKRIGQLRKKIDDIDKDICKLLVKRFDVVLHIARLKKRYGIPLTDRKRENEILEKALGFSDRYGRFLKEIYHQIIRSSKKAQR